MNDVDGARCVENFSKLPTTSEHLWHTDHHGIPVGRCAKCGESIESYNNRRWAAAQLLIGVQEIRKRESDTLPQSVHYENCQLITLVNFGGQCNCTATADRDALKELAAKEIAELTRKGESLCRQNGNLLVAAHDSQKTIAALRKLVVKVGYSSSNLTGYRHRCQDCQKESDIKCDIFHAPGCEVKACEDQK